jgi:hypothetical protein
MSDVSESSPDPNHKPAAGGRRVRTSTAISVVVLAAAVGFLLGIVYPPDRLMSHFRVVPDLEASGAVPAALKTPDPAAVTRTPAPATASPGPADNVPRSDRQRDAAASAVPEALPRPASVPAPAPAADAGRPSGPAVSAEEERGRAPGAESENAKAAGKSSARPKSARRERTARPKRRKNTDTAEAQAKGPAEPPIVGPSTGFVLP